MSEICEACGQPQGVCECGKYCERCGKISDVNDGFENLCNSCAVNKLTELENKRRKNSDDRKSINYLREWFSFSADNKKINMNRFLGDSSDG